MANDPRDTQDVVDILFYINKLTILYYTRGKMHIMAVVLYGGHKTYPTMDIYKNGKWHTITIQLIVGYRALL